MAVDTIVGSSDAIVTEAADVADQAVVVDVAEMIPGADPDVAVDVADAAVVEDNTHNDLQSCVCLGVNKLMMMLPPPMITAVAVDWDDTNVVEDDTHTDFQSC